MSSKRLDQDQCIRLGHTSSRCLQDVFKTFSRHFQDVFKTSCKKVFKTSSRHFEDVFKTFSRHLQHVLPRRLQDVFKTYHQVKRFLLTRLPDLFNTFLRRTAKTVIYRRIYPAQFWDIYGQCIKFARMLKNFSSFSFSLYYIFLVAAYRGIFRTWSNIYNGAFLRKYLKALTC